jgi:CRISPR/Cas system-associated exonuclease Cas4 (RecB family)
MSALRVGLALAAIAALTAALLVQILVVRLRKRTGFSGAGSSESAIAASDTGVVDPIMLRDPILGIRGKPDYLIRTTLDGHQRLVPVEVKPTRRGLRLYDSDRLQLGAYLLALRATAGASAADFGIVRYAGTSFRVGLTADLEAEVRRIIVAARAGRTSKQMPRSHDSVARCRSCAVRLNCDQALAR